MPPHYLSRIVKCWESQYHYNRVSEWNKMLKKFWHQLYLFSRYRYIYMKCVLNNYYSCFSRDDILELSFEMCVCGSRYNDRLCADDTRSLDGTAVLSAFLLCQKINFYALNYWRSFSFIASTIAIAPAYELWKVLIDAATLFN